MRLFRAACAIALAFIALACTAARGADNFPSRPIEIVVTAAAGGSPDILARLIAPALAARLGQTVTVENRPGGGGNVVGALVARAAPDGHTLFLANDQLAVNQTLFPNLPFRADASFTPVMQIAAAPQVLVVHPDLPLRNLADFIASARAAPGQVAVASAAVGTTGQLGVLRLQSQAAIRLNPVVYRSAQPALTDVLGRHVQGLLVSVAAVLPQIRDGRLRALAVSTATRSPALPEVPSFVEQGLPQLRFDSWTGLLVPAGTPRETVERLNRELNAVLRQPDVHEALLRQAYEPKGGSSEAFAALVRESIARWAEVIRAHRIVAE